jgi:hypothetical protein
MHPRNRADANHVTLTPNRPARQGPHQEARMAWYPGATKMELQPESDTQPAIRPTQFIVHSIAAPWDERRIYEYWRDYSVRLRSRYAAAARRSAGSSRNFPRPWLHAVHSRPRTHPPQDVAGPGQQVWS